jgi:hypothetical protein
MSLYATGLAGNGCNEFDQEIVGVGLGRQRLGVVVPGLVQAGMEQVAAYLFIYGWEGCGGRAGFGCPVAALRWPGA